jgi:hypothetical protein
MVSYAASPARNGSAHFDAPSEIVLETCEKWVCAEALPVTATLRDAADVHHGPECNVDALADVLTAHEQSAPPDQLAIESGNGSNLK